MKNIAGSTVVALVLAAPAMAQTPWPTVTPRPLPRVEVWTPLESDLLRERFITDYVITPRFEYDFDFKTNTTLEFDFDRLVSQEVTWAPMPSRRSQDPADSAYRAARSTLNRGEYRKAADELAAFARKYTQSRYRASALYWQSFALYRAGGESDLRRALTILDDLARAGDRHANDAEVKSLTTRVIGALASRGDQSAANRLRSGAASGEQSCDREEMEVRAEALSALVQNDEAGAMPLLQRILERRDECSEVLRRRAVYLLGKDGDPARLGQVLAIAKNDPSRAVQTDAISRLAQVPGEQAVTALEGFLAPGGDERIQRVVVQAVRRRDDPAAARLIRRTVERADLEEAVRVEAITSLASCCGNQVDRARVYAAQAAVAGQVRVVQAERPVMADADVALLRRVYGQSDSRRIKSAVVETLARSGGPATDAWLLDLVRNQNEDIRYRAAALSRLRRTDTSVEELGRLYDTLTERDLRRTVVSILGDREEPAATDKLFDIARNGTDPSIQRAAISELAKKKDPRTTKLLLELLEK